MMYGKKPKMAKKVKKTGAARGAAARTKKRTADARKKASQKRMSRIRGARTGY